MGNCLYVMERRDLNGSTFSHYSLTSSNSYLDLYPELSYVESETSSYKSHWRRSSAPLLDLENSVEPSPTLPLSSSTVTLRCKVNPGSASSTLKSKIRASTTHLLSREKGFPLLLRRSVTLESAANSLTSNHLVVQSSAEETTVMSELSSEEFRVQSGTCDDHCDKISSAYGELKRTSSDLTEFRNRDSNSTVISEL